MSNPTLDRLAARLATAPTYPPAQGFGLDLATVWTSNGPDLDSGFTEVTGITLLIQRLIRRLSTAHGSVVGCPNDCIDIRAYLGAGITNADVQGIQSAIKTQLERDEAVLPGVSVVSQYNPATRALAVKIAGSSTLGPFAMTLAVSQVTISLLNTSANG